MKIIKQDDFMDIMKEVLPHMLQDDVQPFRCLHATWPTGYRALNRYQVRAAHGRDLPAQGGRAEQGRGMTNTSSGRSLTDPGPARQAARRLRAATMESTVFCMKDAWKWAQTLDSG